MKDKHPILLPAGRAQGEEDLRRQLALEDSQPGLALIVLLAGCSVLFLMGIIIAGLTFHHWKPLIF